MYSIRMVGSYCDGDITKIENYDKASTSNQRYDCHHRNEINLDLSREELIERGLYYNRPPEELIFLTHKDHMLIHSEQLSRMMKNKNPMATTESRKKISGSLHYNYKSIIKEDLFREYITNGNNLDECAVIFNVNRTTIARKLRTYGISKRRS